MASRAITDEYTDSICLLGFPHSVPDRTRELQRELRRRHGGRITEDLHLTFQRFKEPPDPERLLVAVRAGQLRPFDVTAVALKTMYSAFRGNTIIKARIDCSSAVSYASGCFHGMLLALECQPTYRGVANLVTFLEGIVGLDEDVRVDSQDLDLPLSLFRVQTLVASRITSKGEFKRLWELRLEGA